MNKILALTALIFTLTTTAHAASNDTFVNPLFYKQLSPVSANAQETHLTPLSSRTLTAIIHHPTYPDKQKWHEQKCELLDNTSEHITLKCERHTEKKDRIEYDISKFILGDCFSKNDTGTCTQKYVTRYDYSKDQSQIIEQKNYTVDTNLDDKSVFINPIFYHLLVEWSRISRNTYITPTSLIFSDNIPGMKPDTWTTKKCHLLENELNYIKMYCEFHNPLLNKKQIGIYKLTLNKCSDDYRFINCRYNVVLERYDKTGHCNSGEWYIIK